MPKALPQLHIRKIATPNASAQKRSSSVGEGFGKRNRLCEVPTMADRHEVYTNQSRLTHDWVKPIFLHCKAIQTSLSLPATHVM